VSDLNLQKLREWVWPLPCTFNYHPQCCECVYPRSTALNERPVKTRESWWFIYNQ